MIRLRANDWLIFGFSMAILVIGVAIFATRKSIESAKWCPETSVWGGMAIFFYSICIVLLYGIKYKPKAREIALLVVVSVLLGVIASLLLSLPYSMYRMIPT